MPDFDTDSYASLMRAAGAVEFVVSMCQQPNPHVRTKALTTLANIADNSAECRPTDCSLTCLTDNLRLVALTQGATSVLVSNCGSADPNVVVCALHAIGRFGAHSTVFLTRMPATNRMLSR